MRNVADLPGCVQLDWEKQYRIIPSCFPPIDFFESLVEPDLMDEAFHIESLTNDRLRDVAGDIQLVSPEDRISGLGATPVMAAFTHIGHASRFSQGDYGVYYAAKELDTAIAETKHHRAKFLASTNEDPGQIDMRVYIGHVTEPMIDIREGFDDYHQANDWEPAQRFGAQCKASNEWGIAYRSVRNPGGECIAALSPRAVSIPVQGPHLGYIWDGSQISDVIELRKFDSSLF